MELKLPVLGENIAQGTVTRILVKAGDSITKGQNILELETDKAVLEVPSPDAGVVSEILVKTGTIVKVGQPVFVLGGKPAGAAPVSGTTPAAAATPAAPSKPAAAPATAGGSGAVVDFILPTLGENIAKGTVTKILVKPGDSVKKGQNLLELETDKAVLEVPAAADLVVKEVLVKAGAVVNIGAPVLKVQMGAAASSGASAPAPAAAAKSSPTAAEIQKPAAASAVPAATTHMPVRANVPAAPSVRLFAREIGIDIGQVPGSGPGGRISVDDVKKYAKALNTSRPAAGSAPATQQPLPDFSKWGSVKREPMNNVRRKTAEHLSSAWQTIPHVTQFDKADITELEKLRKRFSNDKRKLSITPFLIKVIAAALKQFPQFNSAVDMATNEVVYKDYINIGVAVDTDRGLIVPVLKNADRMGIMQISDELTAIAERARARKTTMDELQGGCFTISNLGGIGGTFFTPIVNWPEVAILGVSRGVMEQVYTDGQFVPRLMLPLSLSYDHRIIDGADGARFIRWVSDAIQQPFLLDLTK